MREVSIEEVINNLNNINIIDIRDNYRFNIGNIPNSKNIPMNFLIMNASNYLNNEDTYYIYCEYGVSSKLTCQKLNEMGYDVVNISGGYNAYKLYEHLTK
ncbi:MAG: rhodanese-like domain-containing protein [Bacilli bacterium]|nr:rhodanese-like domain-containing protein [Bacilli bacterium]